MHEILKCVFLVRDWDYIEMKDCFGNKMYVIYYKNISKVYRNFKCKQGADLFKKKYSSCWFFKKWEGLCKMIRSPLFL